MSDFVGRGQDHHVIRTAAYADPGPLKARVNLYANRDRPIDYLGWVLSHVRLTPGMRVLDVGCGYGRALPLVAATGALPLGADLSEGMVAAARAELAVPVVCADLADLPLVAGAFDVVLALHMLYHLPDLRSALAEADRVLRPGGRLVVTTNAAHHLAELRHLLARAAADAMGTAVLPAWATQHVEHAFLLDEAAAVLADAGFAIERFDIDEARLVLHERAPALAHIASTGHFRPPSVDWDAVVDAAAARIDALLAETGTWEITVASGVVVARSHA